MIKGKCVVPATVVCGCIMSHVKQTYPGRTIQRLDDVKLMSGFTVDGDRAKVLCITTVTTASVDLLRCQAFASAGDRRPGYTCRVTLVPVGEPFEVNPAPPSWYASPAETTITTEMLYGDAGLFHAGLMRMIRRCEPIDDNPTDGGFNMRFECMGGPGQTTERDIGGRGANLGWGMDVLAQAVLYGTIARNGGHKGIPNTRFMDGFWYDERVAPERACVCVRLDVLPDQSCGQGEVWVVDPDTESVFCYARSIRMTFSEGLTY